MSERLLRIGEYFFALWLLFIAVATARGDNLWFASGDAPLEFRNVKISRVEGGQIYFSTVEGGETSRPIQRIVRLGIDDEPALNEAEEMFAASNWDAAVDAYLRTYRKTDKRWLKQWCGQRLLQTSSHNARFDAAVIGYVELAMSDPKLALMEKPALPAAQSTYLDQAAAEISRTLAISNLNDEQRQALLSLQLDIARAKGDTAATTAVIEQLSKLTQTNSGPEAARVLADLKLNSAYLAIQKKDFAKAIEEINSASAMITEPTKQADALFLLAQAQHGLALASKNAGALKDAAVAYMRVVAHFQDSPQAPHVAESLVAAAGILEQLNDAPAALKIDREVAEKYSTSPAASAARTAIVRLSTKR